MNPCKPRVVVRSGTDAPRPQFLIVCRPVLAVDAVVPERDQMPLFIPCAANIDVPMRVHATIEPCRALERIYVGCPPRDCERPSKWIPQVQCDADYVYRIRRSKQRGDGHRQQNALPRSTHRPQLNTAHGQNHSAPPSGRKMRLWVKSGVLRTDRRTGLGRSTLPETPVQYRKSSYPHLQRTGTFEVAVVSYNRAATMRTKSGVCGVIRPVRDYRVPRRAATAAVSDLWPGPCHCTGREPITLELPNPVVGSLIVGLGDNGPNLR